MKLVRLLSCWVERYWISNWLPPANDMVGSALLVIVTPDNVDVTPAKALSHEGVTPVNDLLSPGGLSGMLF